MGNSSKSKNTRASEIDTFLVETFKGLIGLVLTLLGFILIIVMPFVFFVMGGASLLSGKWLTGLVYLMLVIVSFYSARGLTELFKKDR